MEVRIIFKFFLLFITLYSAAKATAIEKIENVGLIEEQETETNLNETSTDANVSETSATIQLLMDSDSANETMLENHEESVNEKDADGGPDDDLQPESNSSFTKGLKTRTKDLINYDELRSGISNPQGFLGEVATYQNKSLYAQYAEYPWMMVLLKKVKVQSEFINEHQGGGSLIHSKVVITAAHKVAKVEAENLSVLGGEWDLQSTNETFKHVDIDVEKIVQHENFNDDIKNYHNSIALLILKESFQLNNVINVVRLPQQGMNFDGQRCIANGWGKNKFGYGGRNENILKKIELPVVEHNECQRIARTSRLGVDFDLYEGLLCAGGEIGVDTCVGDGGGPLNCEVEGEKGAYYLAGITATGIGCHSEIPGFYIKVSHYRDWIDEKIKSEHLTLKM